ncbi:MAG: anti-sigma factor RsiW [Alphaproteobacteria bacterium]|jgi:anti-sigma factor RsiW
MTTSQPLPDSDLHAYVDDELDTQARARVHALLMENADDMARVQNYAQQNAALHGLFDPVIDEPVPAALSARASPSLIKRANAKRKIWIQIAAAIALLLSGIAGGWGLRDLQHTAAIGTTPYYVTRAVGAHRIYSAEKRHAVEVVAAEEKHLVRWLSKRLGHPLRTPQLGSAGFHLVGGRLLDVSAKPAAQFMYENDAKRRVTVYVRAYEGGDTAFEFFSAEKTAAFYWNDAPFAYVMVGDIPRAELLKLAQVVYDELNPQ